MELNPIPPYSYMFGVDCINDTRVMLELHYECDSGWSDLIHGFLTIVSMLDVEKAIIVQQIKEKFGSLRIYLFNETEEIARLRQVVEAESSRICEVCGSYEGRKRSTNGWLKTICSECDDDRAAEMEELLK